MTGKPTPEPASRLDRWLIGQLDTLHALLDDVLDIDCGLQDARISALPRRINHALDDILDIESGLHAIAPHYGTHDAFADDRRSATAAPQKEPQDSSLGQFARGLAQRAAGERLAARIFVPIRELNAAKSTALIHALVLDLLHALDHAPYNDHVFDLDHVIDHVLDQDHAPDRAHAIDFDFELARSLSRIRALARNVARFLNRDHVDENDRDGNPDPVFMREIADELNSELTHALVRTLDRAYDEAEDRGCPPNFGDALGHDRFRSREFDRKFDRALAAAVDLLAEVVTDFTGADLTLVELHGVDLHGVRWSTTTQWPPGWQEPIRQASIVIKPDLYEIRDDPRVPTPIYVG